MTRFGMTRTNYGDSHLFLFFFNILVDFSLLWFYVCNKRYMFDSPSLTGICELRTLVVGVGFNDLRLRTNSKQSWNHHKSKARQCRAQYLWQDGCWLTAEETLNTQFIDRLLSVPDCKSQVWAVESERLVFIDVIGKRNCFLRKSMHEELFSTFWLRNVWTGTNRALKKAW